MSTNLVLGFFDGVHLGHQEVIKSAFGGNIILVSLNESPAKFFGKPTKYILTRENSLQKIKSLNVNEVIFENFENIYYLTPSEYIENLIFKYKPNSIITGFNYTFGVNKSGNPEFLRSNQNKYGYKYICVPPFSYKEEIVSSTLIKKYLSQGNIKKANKLLGSNFIIEGTVIYGAQFGRKIGFPTANIKYPQDIIEIPYGAYAIKCAGKIGMMNFGIKPTVNKSLEPIIEVHIIDFNGDLYGKSLKFEIIDKIREEQKFNNTEELRQQLLKDKETCLKLLS